MKDYCKREICKKHLSCLSKENAYYLLYSACKIFFKCYLTSANDLEWRLLVPLTDKCIVFFFDNSSKTL